MRSHTEDFSFFKDATVLITGGTGSFGSNFMTFLLQETQVRQVRIFSRDETKQDEMRRRFHDSRIAFYLGDLREKDSISNALKGVDCIFHAAALKQVPSCEFFPEQAVKTNVIGSQNLISEASKHGVTSLVLLSTDKAVHPINVMGMTKALMEKSAYAFVRNNPESKMKVSCVRYGNVLFSRGSVVPLFINQIRNGNKLTITNANMTRYLMSLEESVELVINAFSKSSSGDLLVKEVPSATVFDLANAVSELMGRKLSYEIIGTRHGEKIHEDLLSGAELKRAQKESNFYSVPLDSRNLNYEAFYDQGFSGDELNIDGLSSNSAKRLTVAEIVNLLDKLPETARLIGS